MAVNEAGGNNATAAAAVSSQRPSASAENSTEESSSSSSVDRPTWDEVEQTRTPVQKQGWPKRYNFQRFCMVDDMFVSMNNFASSSSPESKRQVPITGKMTCLERVAPEMAQQRLAERREKAGESSWATRWYSRWLLDWQVVRILGRSNIMVFQLHSDRLQPSQAILEKVISDKEERRLVTQIEPLDHAVAEWRKASVGFFWRMLEPGMAMSRRMAESWRDGQQQRLFALLWRDTLDMKGVKLVGRIADHVGRVFDEAMDEDGDEDDKGKK